MSMISCVAAAKENHQAVKIHVVSKTEKTMSDQPITLPQGNVGVSVSVYEIPPGAVLPVHKHPFPRYGYVLAGQLRVKNIESGKVTDFSAGDFAVESLDQWHEGTNPGKHTLKLLVIDQAPEGNPNIEVRK